jgi:hypothetical protein
MEETYRQVVDNAHTSYNNIVAGINQVKADKQSILSNASSLRSTIEGYKVGTQTMLDVLIAQQKLYDAERLFSTDEYAYLNATIALKEAAGTLSLDDLKVINSWLSKKNQSYSTLNIETIQEKAEKNYQATLKENAALGIDVSSDVILQDIDKLGETKH